MSTATTIRRLTVETLDIPLLTPFGISGGAQEVAQNLLVTLELADGTRGYGEAAPFPAFNGETQAGARTAILQALPHVEGADVREWRRIANSLREATGHVGSARCAIETAILDALTRQAAMPLWAFFGGVSTHLQTDMTVTTGSVEAAATATLDILQRGIRIIKVKIGSGDPQLDLERIVAIYRIAPNSPLILDGNCGYSAEAALALLSALAAQGIRPALLEQPVKRDDWDGFAVISQHGNVLVATDESVASTSDALRVAQDRLAQVINIKLMKCGIAEALDIAAIARSAGIGLMIGGMVESILAMTTSACFAAGQGGFQFVDLDTPMFLASNPFNGGFTQQGDTLDLSGIHAGHGVTPK